MRFKSVEEIKKALFSKGYGRAVALIAVGALLIMLGNTGVFNQKESEPTAPTEEERLSDICSEINGVGRCHAMITYRDKGGEREVFAVILLCDGADSLSVRRDLTSLVCSLYGIGANRVEIFTINE